MDRKVRRHRGEEEGVNIWQTVALLLVAVGGVALWEISARLVVRAFRDADWTEWFKRRMARKGRAP